MRSAWVDQLRALLVLGVVVYHVRNGALAAGHHVPGVVDDVVRALEPVRMPVLMMLSGLFVPRALAKGARRYVAGKAGALLVPYVAWFLTFYFVLLGETHRPTDRWYVEIVVPQTPLWFLCYLCGYFALVLPLRTPWSRTAALATVVLWLSLGGTDTDWHFLFYLACFLTGAVVADPPAPLGDRWHRLTVRRPGVPTAVSAVVVVVAMHDVVTQRHTERTTAWVLVALAALVVGRAVCVRTGDTAVGRWLAGLGPFTMVLFLAHTALLAASPSPGGSFWASLAVALAFGLLVVEVVRRHEAAWLPFDVRRGWRAIRAREPVSAGAGARGGRPRGRRRPPARRRRRRPSPRRRPRCCA